MNKYTKVRKIGEGSFGTAMLVKSKQNGRQMVIKEINMGRMGRKEREESRKEVAVLAQLNHPNIVTYKESFEELGSLYIVMDYCDGGDLYSRINTQRGVLFTEDQILDWFVQICLSIKHIHDRKILHRDIKSQNIFLTRAGMVKLGDFGIAKVLNSTVELARTCIGTPYYLSPEICENKPYNNKSDVWSLGCVVYEMCTLKHAFEAGNMKNLVLKIIRGSYPPLPTKYSYELRGLVAQLFKRNPRDRPSINAILRKPLLQNRIKKFLNHVELADEFSHTVMHGCQVKKVLSPGRNQPQPIRASPRPKPSPSPTPAYRPATPVRQRAAGMSPKYNPASVYGAPQQSPARKSRENRVRKSSDSSGEGKRPNSAASDLARRRQELIDAEKRRRDAAKKEYANAHQALQAKQQMQKYNKDREKGWKNLVDSLGSDDSTPACAECAPMKEVQNYEHYHDVLNKLERDRNKPKKIQNEAAQEYLQRKREAAEYKARGRADLWGGGGVAAAISPRVVHKPPSVYNARDKQEQDYLAKLRQIRLQNFNERRNNKAGDNPQKVFKDQNSDLRRKKIEALREQADERAKKLKAELEKKRKMIGGPPPGGAVPAGGGGGGGGAGVVYLKKEDVKPAPALPMTAAMQAIGAKPAQPVKASEKVNIGLTAAMNAIGAVAPSAPSPTSPVSPSPAPVTPTPVTSAGTPTSANSQDRSEIQKKKETILKRLNSKSKEGAIGAESNKSKWADTYDKRLRELSLEETASNMEATSAADVVIKYTDKPAVPRKSWGVPAAGEAVPQIATQLTDTASSTASKTDTGTISLGSSEGGGSDVAGTSSPPSTNSRGDETTATEVHDKNIQEQQKDATITVLSSGDPGVKDLPKVNNLPKVKDTQDKEKLVEEEDDSTPDGNENGEDSQGEEAPKLTWAQKAAEVGKQGTFVSGLSTGQFDVKNVEVLRTCSEPDLLRLFATNFSPLSSLDEKQKTRRLSLGDDNDETLTELDLQALKATYKGESSISYSTSSSDSLEGTHTQISEDIEEEVEADEEEVDEDLLTVRQSMMDILQEEEEEPLSALKIAKSKRKTKKTLTTKKKPKKKSKKKTIVAEMDDGNRTAEGIQTMKETLASLLQPQQQSDSDSDEYFEDGSMFSELEEKRANLEEQLGCDVFRKAYKTVQAIHDNEDENMSEGIQLISDMLGPHNHLYPSILQLVMADGVFTEDND